MTTSFSDMPLARQRTSLQVRCLRGLITFAAVALGAWTSGVDPASAFTLGIYDPSFSSSDAQARAALFDRSVVVHATWVRIALRWSTVAPVSPRPTFDARDPADPQYRWGALDDAVRDATARRLKVLLTVNGAPAWAEGSDRPREAAAGSWKPSPAALGDFAYALARRYSGTFPRADASQPLPRVRAYQVWNEPNLALYLSPQWERRSKRWQPAAAARYRDMLNTFSTAIHRVHRDNLAVTAGTAPYGDSSPGGSRIRPVSFWSAVFCLSPSLRHRTCHERTTFDVLSHHPYAVGGPLQHALSAEDAAIPDIGRIRQVLNAAQRSHTISPSSHPKLWVTEVSWDSGPPDPDGIPIDRHARWLAMALYMFWRQGVSNVFWFRVEDEAPRPTYAATTQSGLFFLSGEPKPAAKAFAFPFVVMRRGRHGVEAWGMAPRAGAVTLERRSGKTWRPIVRMRPHHDRVFHRRLSLRQTAEIRAVQGRRSTASWHVRTGD